MKSFKEISLKYFIFVIILSNNSHALIKTSNKSKEERLSFRCFMVSTQLFRSFVQWPYSEIDNKLRFDVKNLILDYYRMKTKSGKQFPEARSQIHITLSVIIQHLNLSISNCEKLVSSSKTKKYDINFAVDTYQKQINRRSGSQLFYPPGEITELKFMSSRRVNHFLTLTMLIGPLGYKVATATIVLILVNIGILALTSILERKLIFMKSGKNHPIPIKAHISNIISSIIRPLLDQCEERHEALPSRKFYFRLILSTWLYYCLIVTETYRSELISHLMKPQFGVSWLKTFIELDHDDNNLIHRVGFRPGQTTTAADFIKAEIQSCNSTQPERALLFEKILDKMNTTLYLFYQKKLDFRSKLKSGQVHLVGDSFLLASCCKLFEKFSGVRVYEMSTESIQNRVYWSVNSGPFQTPVLKILQNLRDSGILNYFKSHQDLIDHSLVRHQLEHNFFNVKNETEKKRLLQGGPQVLKVEHIIALLLLLAFGSGLSFFIFVAEFYCKQVTIRSTTVYRF